MSHGLHNHPKMDATMTLQKWRRIDTVEYCQKILQCSVLHAMMPAVL